MNCPHCNHPIQGDLVRKAAARESQSRRVYTRKLRPCPYCAMPFGARELIKHRPSCRKKFSTDILP